MKKEKTHLDHLAEVIERTYNHPDISPWHAREALRLLLAEIRELSARLPKK